MSDVPQCDRQTLAAILREAEENSAGVARLATTIRDSVSGIGGEPADTAGPEDDGSLLAVARAIYAHAARAEGLLNDVLDDVRPVVNPKKVKGD